MRLFSFYSVSFRTVGARSRGGAGYLDRVHVDPTRASAVAILAPAATGRSLFVLEVNALSFLHPYIN